MIMLRPLIGVGIKDYLINIYFKVAIVVLSSVILPSIVYIFMHDGLLRFIVVGIVCVTFVSASVYILGLSKNEKAFVRTKILSIVG